MISCKKESDTISADLVVSVKTEASMDAQQDEIDDIAIGQLVAKSAIGGKATVSADDDRVACAKVTADIGSDKQGTILIDFDQTQDGSPNPGGCIDPRGNSRKGKIIISWVGAAWYQQGAIITIALDNYKINGVAITGGREIHNITDDATPLIQVSTVFAQHEATWPDGSTASRTIHKTRTWDVLQETLTVTQTPGTDDAASGQTKNGKQYSVTITEGLVYTQDCVSANVYIPIRGKETFTVNDANTLHFDFGDGTCDNIFTLSYNGLSQTVLVSYQN